LYNPYEDNRLEPKQSCARWQQQRSDISLPQFSDLFQGKPDSRFTNYHVCRWLNVTSNLMNNYLTFNWVSTGATNTYTTYTVYIPNGLYEISQIVDYLQWVFINAPYLSTSFISPMYLVDSAGKNVYYFELLVNPTSYAIQLNTYSLPASLPAGYTNPAGMVLPAQTYNPVVSTPLNFNKLIGFASTFQSAQNQNNSGTNPGVTTADKIGSTYSYLSTLTPQVQPNPNLLLTISNVDNKYANPSTVIYSISPSVALGELIVDKPPEFNWNEIINGTYNELRVTLLGTDLNSVQIEYDNSPSD
jgi:hypothetical protein